MAKVDMELGFTLHIGPESSNQYVRLNVKISEINTDLPIPDQIGKINDCLDAAYSMLSTNLDDKVSESFNVKIDRQRKN